MKNHFMALAVLILILDPMAAYAHRMEEVKTRPSIPGQSSKNMIVYLPDSYDSEENRYPVLYLLHGARGNERSWIQKGKIIQIIDSLEREGMMQETIVVFPNMNMYEDDEDYGNSRPKGAWESFFEMDGSTESTFMKDVVGLVDSLYRTIPEKNSRAIAGLSLGGMQAIQISASNPDSFGYVGAFSPLVSSVVKKGDHSGFYRRLGKRLMEQFRNPPELYSIMVGKRDFLEPHLDSFHNYLNEHGYEHEYRVKGGGHQWKNWISYCTLFMKELWK